mmetsp:Transcript_34111/g.82610  ORF Transcript_34111/g.82610 Transcript_34111/m.82610 type:complete len:186 (-) Transcript_34111:172-729(-)
MGFPVVKMKIRKETSPLDCGLILHDRIPSLGASVDFITADGRIGEVKCPFSEEGKRSLDDPAVQANVPDKYMFQLQVQLEVCNVEEAILVRYRPDDDRLGLSEKVVINIVKRDRNMFHNLMKPLITAWIDEFVGAKRLRAEELGNEMRLLSKGVAFEDKIVGPGRYVVSPALSASTEELSGKIRV